jgi:hypothetical protein
VRRVPRRLRYKPLLVLGALILAGCGSSTPAKPQLVRATGFSFEAPAGWQVKSAKGTTSATSKTQLVEVTTFPLVKRYDDALFAKVARELALRMREVATQLHGKVTHARTFTVDGVRSHSYDVTVGGDVIEYTFVLRGKQEFQLLCRSNTAGADFCVQLLKTFAAS